MLGFESSSTPTSGLSMSTCGSSSLVDSALSSLQLSVQHSPAQPHLQQPELVESKHHVDFLVGGTRKLKVAVVGRRGRVRTNTVRPLNSRRTYPYHTLLRTSSSSPSYLLNTQHQHTQRSLHAIRARHTSARHMLLRVAYTSIVMPFASATVTQRRRTATDLRHTKAPHVNKR